MSFRNYYINEEKVDDLALFVGRLQPPHLGHEKIINDAFKKNKRVVIVIVEGKKTKEDKKNFLTFEQRKDLIKKINPKVEVIKSHTAFIGFILYKLLKITSGNITVYAGPDRVKSYENSEKDNEFYDFTFKETERITSATDIRNTFKNDTYKDYKKISARKLNTKKEFDFLKDLWEKKQK